MTVYLDIVFIENICMNYIILYATVLLLKLNNKPFRILVGSVIGAIYAVLSVTKIFESYNSIFLKILISIIIIYVSADTKNFKSLFKAVLVFYFVSFTFGGIALALLYFVKPENILMRNGVYIGTYTIKIVLLGGIVGFILISVVYSIIKSKHSKKKKVCEIKFAMEGNEKQVKALIDSGNFLKEPITGVPVVVVETMYLFGIVPKEILENIDDIICGNLEFLTNLEEENENIGIGKDYDLNEEKVIDEVLMEKKGFKVKEKIKIEEQQSEITKFLNKFRVIPFNSLGKENGLLLGIKADYLQIIENEEFEHQKIENIIIGLYDKKLSKERFV